jgi:hypothetical protein
MNPSRKRGLLVLICLFLAASLANIYFLHQQSQAYLQGMEAYAQVLNYEERLLNLQEWLEPRETERRLRIARGTRAEAEMALNKAQQHAGLQAGTCLLFLLILWGLSRGQAHGRRYQAIGLMGVALLCLLPGLFTPILEIGAFQRDLTIPVQVDTGFLGITLDHIARFEGDIYFYYQSKSVVALIGLLMRQGNLVVGLSILLFSLLIPLTKSLLSIWAWSRPALNHPAWVESLIQRPGKWSMADVFVAAMFLAFLAFSNLQTGITTESHTLPGLYFFLAYVLLSLLAGEMMRKR